MNTLIVEDDAVSRRLICEILKPFGECRVAENGVEAVREFDLAVDENRPFDLICLDIMMPEMDGHDALKRLRNIEESHGILSHKGAKIIMTTALDDPHNVIDAFMGLCDGYVVKPISKRHLLSKIEEVGLKLK